MRASCWLPFRRTASAQRACARPCRRWGSAAAGVGSR
uniref:Uncharacterized protein n=1 Tax=Arundo donax TaxID=35708 RepID=A0A0A8YH28_ARUDO